MPSKLLLLVISTLSSIFAASFTPTPLPANPFQLPTAPTAGTHYSPTLPPTITINPSQSTAINLALSSVEATFRSPYSYKQLESKVFLAAPTDAQLSLAVDGYAWDDIVKAPWYQTAVDVRWRNMINVQEKALQSAVDAVVGGAGRTRGGSGWGVGVMAVCVGLAVLGVVLL